jgi:hypothetical protein
MASRIEEIFLCGEKQIGEVPEEIKYWLYVARVGIFT